MTTDEKHLYDLRKEILSLWQHGHIKASDPVFERLTCLLCQQVVDKIDKFDAEHKEDSLMVEPDQMVQDRTDGHLLVQVGPYALSGCGHVWLHVPHATQGPGGAVKLSADDAENVGKMCLEAAAWLRKMACPCGRGVDTDGDGNCSACAHL